MNENDTTRNNEPTAHDDSEADDCAYFLDRAFGGLTRIRKISYLVLFLAITAGLASVLVNLGAIELNALKVCGIEIAVKKLWVLRLFLTALSVAATLSLYFILEYKHNENVVYYLANQKKYKRAQLILSFAEWNRHEEPNKFLQISEALYIAFATLIAILTILLPLGTFVYSWFGAKV